MNGDWNTKASKITQISIKVVHTTPIFIPSFLKAHGVLTDSFINRIDPILEFNSLT